MEKVKKRMKVIFAVAILMIPVVSIAGSLEPPLGAPAPTMKTLDQIPPTWSIDLPPGERFVSALPLHGNAVLDKETGLVWQSQVPPEYYMFYNWYDAFATCDLGGLNFNNKTGWRLPTLNELRSLFYDYNTPPGSPDFYSPIPPGQSEPYAACWTSTSDISDPNKAYLVDFRASSVGVRSESKDSFLGAAWCVRGPLGN